MKSNSLATLTYAVVLVALLGSFFVISKSILVPIFIAAIAAYVLVKASNYASSLPGLRRCPDWISRFIVLVLFAIIVVIFFGIVVVTIQELLERLPEYQVNFEVVVQKALELLGQSTTVDFQHVYEVTFGRIDLKAMALSAVSSISSAGGTIFLIIIYTAFLMGERGMFVRKIQAATTSQEQADKVMNVVSKINQKIADYLATKTLINIILGALSFVILTVIGVDFALFWAILIALLNYIPYVGSALGVALPVLLSIAQLGSFNSSILVLVLLLTVQLWVGNYLEPRMIGKRLNMSPFVVLLSLSVFSALWGLAGAILAVPLTSILAIVLGSFDGTRFLAMMLAENIQADENGVL